MFVNVVVHMQCSELNCSTVLQWAVHTDTVHCEVSLKSFLWLPFVASSVAISPPCAESDVRQFSLTQNRKFTSKAVKDQRSTRLSKGDKHDKWLSESNSFALKNGISCV